MLFKNPVRTSKRTPYFTITKINWLTLFKEVIDVYTGKHLKSINTKFSVAVQYASCGKLKLKSSMFSLYPPNIFKQEFFCVYRGTCFGFYKPSSGTLMNI
jgi:hypothetical protein